MSSIYNGSAALITAHQAVAITVPADGDALNALSINAALKALADIEEYLQEQAALGNGYNNVATTTGNPGLKGTGLGTGAGVYGQGGATGSGGKFNAGAGGWGVEAYANSATLAAGYFGNTSTGLGIDVNSFGGTAVKATAGSGGYALWGIGSAGIPAGYLNPAGNTPADWALQCARGSIKMSGANPALDLGFANQLAASNIVKAWAKITFSAGVATINAGFNVATAVVNVGFATGAFAITLVTAVPMATRATVALQTQPASFPPAVDFGVGSDTQINFVALDVAAGNRNLTTGTHVFSVVVLGLQ
jgi:hypothetical protein